MDMKFTLIRDVKSPEKAHPTDAAFDLFVPNDFPETTLVLWGTIQIPLGVKIALPENHSSSFRDKSGISSKYGVRSLGGLFDSAFSGEYILTLEKTSNGMLAEDFVIRPGMKIIQLTIDPVPYIIPIQVSNDEFDSITAHFDRGTGSHGSTGA